MQTSIGFETQGLTVYEAAAVGTPTVLCDPKIAAELPGDSNWLDSKGTIDSLAKTIKQANKDISEGKTKRENLADTSWLYQSEISRQMMETYRELIRIKTK